MTTFERALLHLCQSRHPSKKWLSFGVIEVALKSGRTFRYQMQDYPFSVDATEVELDNVACRIIKDKYRYCEWDRNHPKSDSEVEIFDAIKNWMMEMVALARKAQAEKEGAEKAEKA